MTQLVVSRLAQSDTASIVSGLAARASHGVASRYAAHFEALYERLLAYPESGPLRVDIGPSARIGLVPPYIVVYDFEQDQNLVTILRILHGRRRITGELLRTT